MQGPGTAQSMPETPLPAAAEKFADPIRLCWLQMCCLAVQVCQKRGQDFGQQPVTSEAVLWLSKQACCAAEVSAVSRAWITPRGSCVNATAITFDTM